MLKDLIFKNRSYRRFHQEYEVHISNLKDLIDLARLSPSARNAQPLKYFLSNTQEINSKIFPHLAWAGYLADWPGPKEGERPSAYIVVLLDTDISDNCFCDDGIASQSILLGATELGLGGCIIASVNRPELKMTIELSDKYKILHVIALGKPKEIVKLEEMKGGDIKYWRDTDCVHHVPKRSIDDMII